MMNAEIALMLADPKTEFNIDYRPREWQYKTHLMMGTARFGVIIAHRRSGKTVSMVASLFEAAIDFDPKVIVTNDGKVIGNGEFGYIAPFLKQAKKNVWKYFKMFARRIPGCKINESELWVELPNGCKIRIYGADNYDAIRGDYFDGVVIDEVADMRANVWEEVLLPMLADRQGWAIFIGTPKGQNLLFDLYNIALADKTGAWHASMWRVDETGALQEAEVELQKSIMSERTFRQEFECDFTASADNVLITLDMALMGINRRYMPRDVIGSPKIIGVDVAREGDDTTVIQKRQGLVAYDPISIQGKDNMEIVGVLVNLINEWSPDAVFIDIGAGAGVIDRLRQLGYNVQAVNFGAKAGEVQYANKRMEMWDNVADWLQLGGMIPNHARLIQDLCTPTYKYDRLNRLLLEAKEDVKKRLRRSPDFGDALALTFAYPVTAKNSLGQRANTATVITEYDPHKV